MKELPFVSQKYTKGVPFPSKMVYKNVRGWTAGRSLLYKDLLSTPGAKRSPRNDKRQFTVSCYNRWMFCCLLMTSSSFCWLNHQSDRGGMINLTITPDPTSRPPWIHALNVTINQKILKYILYIQSKDEESLVKQAFLMSFDSHCTGKNSFHSHLMNMSEA